MGADLWQIAAQVVDPELPMLTLADLGVLRRAEISDTGHVLVSIRPTYLGCPAMDAMRDELVRIFNAAGYEYVDVSIDLSEPWSSDDISPDGRARLAAAGISPPTRATERRTGPVPLALGRRVRVACPRCGSDDTAEVSHFGATACRSLFRCAACSEPFEHVKEI